MNYLFPLIAQEHYQVVKSISRGRPEPMKKTVQSNAATNQRKEEPPTLITWLIKTI